MQNLRLIHNKEGEIADEMQAESPLCYSLVLPLPPSTNHLYLGIMGTGRRVLSRRAEEYKISVGKEALSQGVHRPLQGSVGVSMAFYGLPVNADIANREKALMDALNEIAWKDDRQIDFLALSRHKKDSRGARVEMLIYDATHGPICPAWGKLCQRVLSPPRS